MPVAGCQMLDAGCRIQDTGYRMQESGYRMEDFKSIRKHSNGQTGITDSTGSTDWIQDTGWKIFNRSVNLPTGKRA